MEICLRYYSFFESQHHYIPQVLENFVRLVHHNHVKVRTRSWYLFFRFVKNLRAQVGNMAKTVIGAISDLLPIKAELPTSNDADNDMSSDKVDDSADAVFQGQLYLYEAIGYISSTSTTPVEDQALYARSIMQPLFADMNLHMPRAKAGDAQAILQIDHIIQALGTLANGFSETNTNVQQKQRPPSPKPVSDEFSQAASAILLALRELNTSSEVRHASRTALSRLLGVMGTAVLPQLPQWIEGLLSQSSNTSEMAVFLRLLGQIVYKFKADIRGILDLLLTPLLERVFAGLAEPTTGTDDEIQLQELRQEFVLFIQVIFQHGLGDVLVSEANQGVFDSLVSAVITVGKEMVHGNMSASRVAFNVLSRMTVQWGGPDVATVGKDPATSGPPAPLLPGFDGFVLDRFYGACWEVVRDARFKPGSDAQARQLLGEMMGLQQTIYRKTGDSFVRLVQNVTAPTLGLDAGEFLRALTTSEDRKGVVTYVVNLLRPRR